MSHFLLCFLLLLLCFLRSSSSSRTLHDDLSTETLAQISTPRCGVSDNYDHGGGGGGRGGVNRFAYFPGQPRWIKPPPLTLTYALSPNNTINYINQSLISSAVHRAFDRWAKVIPVRFLNTIEYESADVKIAFYAGDHGDGEPFDGVLGVLGHAFSPESGRLHLDKAERWAVDFEGEDELAIDLESVVTHEIGHVLGLGHSAVREAVMFPSLRPRTKKVELSVDDVEGVQSLYGSNPNFKMSSVLESDTSGAGGGGGFLIGWTVVGLVVTGMIVA